MENQQPNEPENPMVKKRWFGRGIYGSKDVPIRVLDGFIGILIVTIIAMIIFFALRGGFWVTFDSDGGTEIEKQKVRHGEMITEPEIPVKPGFVFEGWNYQDQTWNFDTFPVTESMTLTAQWRPAAITVKFDLDGGTVNGSAEIPPMEVIYEETYGNLPVPQKDGFSFTGWSYSGKTITADTQVLVNGEHVLTAQWN